MRDDRATIRRLLGDVPVQPLDAGLDHRVYAVGEGLVARFGEGAAAEGALLAAVAPQLPLPVPVPVAVEAGCVVLPRVTGSALLELPRAARRPFAWQLRAFVQALHALDAPGDLPADDTAPEEWRAEAHDNWAAVRDEVPASRRSPVDAFLAADAPPRPARRRLIHGDLGAEHVFVDADRITGVIDWGDATIGDPALDHGRLLRDFGRAAGGGERARFYAVCTAIEDLAFGLRTDRYIYSENALAALYDLT